MGHFTLKTAGLQCSPPFFPSMKVISVYTYLLIFMVFTFVFSKLCIMYDHYHRERLLGAHGT